MNNPFKEVLERLERLEEMVFPLEKRPEKPRTLADLFDDALIQHANQNSSSSVWRKAITSELASLAIRVVEKKIDEVGNCDCSNIRCQEGCINVHNLKEKLRQLEGAGE